MNKPEILLIGIGGRLGTMQVVSLNVKLKHYKEDLALRRKVAIKYIKVLGSDALASQIFFLTFIPLSPSSIKNKVQIKLKEKGILTAVHYPMPLHLQEGFQYVCNEKIKYISKIL